MFFTSRWLPSRIPFTILLLPLFWIVLLLSPNLNEWRSLWVLIIVHVFLYGAANVYASASPVGIHKLAGHASLSGRLLAAILLHTVAIGLAFWRVNITFTGLVTGYGLVVYAFAVGSSYTHSPTFASWVLIRLAQGLVATALYYTGLNNFLLSQALQWKVVLPGIIASLTLAAYFPWSSGTQTGRQQHGVRFRFTRAFYLRLSLLLLASVLTLIFFTYYISDDYHAGIVLSFAFGVLLLIDRHQDKDTQQLVTVRPLWLHWLATLGLNAYAFYLFVDYTQILQLLR
jgi:1,4-dihydroxy-2-naphthoate octaprenyltransferase